MSAWGAGGRLLQLVPEKGSPESPYPRCSRLLRVLARSADMGVAYALAIAAGRAGLVVALLYVLLADGIFHGQSAGKRIFGVRAVFLPLRAGARFRDSTLRNAPLALVVLLRMMPEPLDSGPSSGGWWSSAAWRPGSPCAIRLAGALEMCGPRRKWWMARSSPGRRRRQRPRAWPSVRGGG